jgi:hypothetical protein
MLGFANSGNEALVWYLGDPQRAVAAYHELLRRGSDAAGEQGRHGQTASRRFARDRDLGRANTRFE